MPLKGRSKFHNKHWRKFGVELYLEKWNKKLSKWDYFIAYLMKLKNKKWILILAYLFWRNLGSHETISFMFENRVIFLKEKFRVFTNFLRVLSMLFYLDISPLKLSGHRLVDFPLLSPAFCQILICQRNVDDSSCSPTSPWIL